MHGLIDYVHVRDSRGKNINGFIGGDDGKMYWFSLESLRQVKVGDNVNFTGGLDEKGFIASHITLIV